MSKKKIPLLLLAALGALTFLGCGSSSSTALTQQLTIHTINAATT